MLEELSLVVIVIVAVLLKYCVNSKRAVYLLLPFDYQ
jgi:hypothetical protein